MIRNDGMLVFFVDDSGDNGRLFLSYIKTKNPDAFLENSIFDGTTKIIEESIGVSEIIKTLNRIIKSEANGCDVLLINKNGKMQFGSISKMKNILYDNDHHAFVSPRMNMNLFRREFPEENKMSGYRCDLLYEYAKKYFTDYSISPYPNPNLVLMKGLVLDNLGGLNEKFTDLYSAVCDLAMRWNKYGYSSIVANHCFFNLKKEIQYKFEYDQINRDYPEFKISVKNFNVMSVDPMEHFSEILSGIFLKKKIVFYFLPIQPIYNGTSEYAFALINSLYTLYGNDYEFSILISSNTYQFFRDDIPDGIKIIFEERLQKAGVFDLVFLPVQLFNVQHLPNIFSLAPRNIGVLLDVIALRSMYISGFGESKNLNALFIELCDCVLSISETSLFDIKGYFNSNFKTDQLASFVHLASDFSFSHRGKDNIGDADMPSFLDKKYVLIFGNSFRHKSTKEAVDSLRNVDTLKVVIGDRRFGYGIKRSENFIFLPSGSISESIMQKIYKNAHLLVFPSQYEGFGLPIFKAIQNCKKVLVYDSSINHELHEYFVKNKNQVIFFNRFSDLSKLVMDNMMEYSIDKTDLPSWEDVARETKEIIDKVLQKPIDPQIVRLRWYIAKLWPNKEVADYEISIKMLQNLSMKYFRRKFKRYRSNFIEFLKRY